MRLIDADRLMNSLRGNVLVDVTPALEEAIMEQSIVTVNDVVNIDALKTVLKEAYLEVANNYSISDLLHDSDRVACVASQFRQIVMDKLNLL